MFNNVINFPKIHVDFVDEMVFCIHKLWVDVSNFLFNIVNYLIVGTRKTSWLNVPWQIQIKYFIHI